jgi:transcriptional regulator with XRE-family HTH domain
MAGKKDALAQDREVGKRIRVRRLQLQMSQTSLGDALGLTFQQVQKYEKGVNRVGAGRLHQIAKILDVSTSYFFDNARSESGAGNELFELLDTAYSLRLIKAFANLEDPQVRRSVVELIEGIAKQAKSPSRRGA